MGNVFKFILPVLAIALTTWGHWPKADEAILQNPFQEQKLILNLQSMVEQGTLSASAVDRSRATPGNLMLPAGSQLLALVNTSCAQAGSGRKHTQSVGDVRDAILPVQAYSLELLSETSVRQLSDELEQDPCIVGVTENAEVHISGEFTNDPGLAQQTAMAAIRADLGYDFLWGSSFKINQDVIIAIVDTGVAYTHPDLTNSMWRNAANQVGFDFINNDTDPMDDNDPGHGTHVAGLAAATGGNAVGISGVMGYRAKIMAVKCMDAEGSGTIAGIVNGLRYAVTNGAHVVNFSLGGRGLNAAMQQALNEAVAAGVVILAASGNDGEELTNVNTFTPASYGSQLAGVLTVGSFDANSLARSGFSNFSTTYVELGAPGSQGNGNAGIVSTLPNNLYGNLRGTSMATPVAAGAAGLVVGFLRTRGIAYTPADVERILRESAVISNNLSGDFAGGSRLDLLQLSVYLQNSYVFPGNPGLESD